MKKVLFLTCLLPTLLACQMAAPRAGEVLSVESGTPVGTLLYAPSCYEAVELGHEMTGKTYYPAVCPLFTDESQLEQVLEDIPNVWISGETLRPGRYVIDSTTTLDEAVSAAVPFSYAYRRRAFVRIGDSSQLYFADEYKNVPLKDGATVFLSGAPW